MNYKTVYKAILLFSIVAAIIAGIFMTVSFFHVSDNNGLNVYSSDNVEFYGLVSWIFVLCAVSYVVTLAVLRKRIDKRTDFVCNRSRFAYGLMAFVSAGLLGFCLGREFFTADTYDCGNMYVIFQKEHLANTQVEEVSYLYLLFLIALVGACAFFAYAVLRQRNGVDAVNEKFGAFSMLPSVAIAVKIIYDFLLQSGHGYGALYNFHLLGLGFTLLFSVYESRFYFKKAAPALYVFFGLVAAAASLIFSIPALILFFAGKAGANWHPAFCLADIVIVAYIYIRLFALEVHQFERQKKETQFSVVFEENEAEDLNSAENGEEN